MKMKKSLYVHVNMHFISVVYHHGYNITVPVLCVICVLNQIPLVHVKYPIFFKTDCIQFSMYNAFRQLDFEEENQIFVNLICLLLKTCLFSNEDEEKSSAQKVT